MLSDIDLQDECIALFPEPYLSMAKRIEKGTVETGHNTKTPFGFLEKCVAVSHPTRAFARDNQIRRLGRTTHSGVLSFFFAQPANAWTVRRDIWRAFSGIVYMPGTLKDTTHKITIFFITVSGKEGGCGQAP